MSSLWVKAATREELEAIALESEAAKQYLRAAGYGVTGSGILQTVKDCLEAIAANRRDE